MTEWIDIDSDSKQIPKEKIKGKKLCKTQWWKNKISKGLCHYCCEKFDPKELTMDHIIPLSRGGKSAKGNVVPCCIKCNREKKYYTPVDILIKELHDHSSDNS